MSADPGISAKTPEESLWALTELPERYVQKGLIGQGGMGLVFRAYDQVLARDVAIKILLAAESHDSAAKERFTREAKALAGLDHQSIVKLLSFGVGSYPAPGDSNKKQDHSHRR